MFCIKEGTCVRNKDSKWANILKTYMPSLSPFCTLAGKQAWSCSRVLPRWEGAWLRLQNQPAVVPREGSGGAWSKVGSFSTLGCFVWMWACSGTFIGAEHTVGTSRWNSSGRAGDDPGWFYREWIVLIAPGKDREAWVNHVHPPWWSCLGHAVFACTIIRHGSIFKWTTVGTGNPAWITQLSHENLQVTHLQTPSYWCWPTPLTWAGVSSCCGCPAVMPGRAELKNEGLSGSLTPPGPALSLLLCQEK